MSESRTRSAAEDARRQLVQAQARLAEAALAYADARREEDAQDPRFGVDVEGERRARPGEFAADELAVAWRDSTWAVRGLLARSRRVRTGLPTVWQAHRDGEVDTEQVRTIDRAARRACEGATLVAIDERSVEAARTRTPKQLATWLLRLVVELEPLAFAARHRRALADRRVTVVQGLDGMGYVTGELTAADVTQIDQLLTALARDLGPGDERTEQQRRADLMADLLLGRLQLIDRDTDEHPSEAAQWVEVEDVDPDTGELLGSHLETVDSDGELSGPLADSTTGSAFGLSTQRRPRTLRIGVVVPLASLLGLSDTPGQLVDRSNVVPVQQLRDAITTALCSTDNPDGPADKALFTRLLTDDGGRLLDTRELGRHPSRRLAEAVTLRAGTCRFPTCTIPADQCDLDHHEPVPRGPTEGANLDPACRRHHRGKTFAWLATRRDRDAVDWTLPDAQTYRVFDDPLPVG